VSYEPYAELTYAEEQELATVVCSLHPHKTTLPDIRPQFFVIRPGWGNFLLRVLKSERGSSN
jgi:hypothetical protein